MNFPFSVLYVDPHHGPQALYDSALLTEASSDWEEAAERWRECVNETLRQTEECRLQCEVASQRLPEDRGVDGVGGVFEKAAGKKTTKPFVLLTKTERERTINRSDTIKYYYYYYY